jgi:hypothetical protein
MAGGPPLVYPQLPSVSISRLFIARPKMHHAMEVKQDAIYHFLMYHGCPGSIPGQVVWDLEWVFSELPRVYCGIEVKHFKMTEK